MSNITEPTCPPGWKFNKTLCKCEKDVIVPPPPPPTSLKYKFSYKFGSKGSGNGQFLDPHDVSFDRVNNNVFIPDRDRNDVQVFTHDGQFVKKFGGPGSGPGQFNVPYSTAHDFENNFYVTDRENNRLQKLTNDGVFILELKGINGKNFVMPEDISFDPVNNDIYMCDTGNNRIIKMDKDLNFILEWGSEGTGDGQFNHPHAVDVDRFRNVYISCGFLPYIQKFTPEGKFIKKWGKEGTGDGEMIMFLEHMDIDIFDRLHLINNNIRPVVQVWDLEGNYLTKYGSEKEGSADGELAEPEHVTVDNIGRPFIVDSGNFRVQVFAPEGASPPPPPPPPVCPPGQHLENGVCVPDVIVPPPPPPVCPPGQHLENGVCVPDVIVPPPPPPPPPTGDVLWDSNVHLKTGQEFTITGTHGDTGPDGKGIMMAASGSPKLVVHADGSFDLEADAGHGRAYIMAKNYNAMMEGEIMIDDDFNVVRNSTWRLRSRHQEGGACENRGGGFGATFEMQEQLAEYETESCHNVHENSIKKPLTKKVQPGQWIKFRYYLCNKAGDSGVDFRTDYDYNDGSGWVNVATGDHPNPPAQLMDKALNEKNSYAWLRMNNEGHGKVHFKNVRIVKISSIP